MVKKTNKLCNSEWPHLFGFTTQDVGLFLKISLQFKQLILPFTILQKIQNKRITEVKEPPE